MSDKDVARILESLPASGKDDTVTQLMEAYETIERTYRAGVLTWTPCLAYSTSANLGAVRTAEAEA